MENNTELKVIILDTGIATKTIENVKIIRIKSDKYNLLIMKDYCPVIGEINGSIAIEADEPFRMDDVRAFYALSKNVFHLIIKEKISDATKA